MSAWLWREILPGTSKPVILHQYLDGVPARGGKGHATEVWLYEVQGGTHSWAFMSRFMYYNDPNYDEYGQIVTNFGE